MVWSKSLYFPLFPIISHYFPLFLREILPNVEDGTGLSLRNALRSTCPFWVQFWKGSKYCSKCWHPQRLNMFESLCSLINGKPCGQFQRAFCMDHIDHVSKKSGVPNMWYCTIMAEEKIMVFRETSTKLREAHGTWYMLYRFVSIDVPLEDLFVHFIILMFSSLKPNIAQRFPDLTQITKYYFQLPCQT